MLWTLAVLCDRGGLKFASCQEHHVRGGSRFFVAFTVVLKGIARMGICSRT